MPENRLIHELWKSLPESSCWMSALFLLGGMHIGKRKRRYTGDNVVNRQAFLVPKYDVLDSNTMTSDKRTVSARSNADLNVGCRI